MIISKAKRNSGLVISGVLLVVLSLLIIETLSVPVYGLPGGPRVLCGTGQCLCHCVAIPIDEGSCDCIVQRMIGCFCWCTGGDWDECEIDPLN